jgi:hypothetical protein
MKKILALGLLLAPSLALAQPAGAPPPAAPPAAAAPAAAAPTANPTPADPMVLFRSDLRNAKADIIAKNMQMTATQAAAFWPIYKKYEADYAKIQDGRLAMLKDYVQNMDSLTDAKAKQIMATVLARKGQMLKMRTAYEAQLTKVLPPTVVLRFFQIDMYISTLLDLQIQSLFPLVS